MAVISIIINESDEQIIDGIPRFVSVSTNISSSIFYTLDGSDPTLMSDQYLEPILLSSNASKVILKVFATNGVDSSPIVEEQYVTNNHNQRKPHSLVSGITSERSSYPFGSTSSEQSAIYSYNAGITQSSAGNTNYSNSFDADGNPIDYSDKPYDQEHYTINYENKNSNNDFINIGVLPANIKIKPAEPISDYSMMYSNFFDPKAMVVFQDYENQKSDDVVSINREYFSLDNKDTDSYGSKFFSTAEMGNQTHSATFIRSEYNPRTNKISYYYRDQRSNKWIISTQEFKNTGGWTGNLSPIVLNSRPGSKYVYEWVPGIYRTLI